LQSSAIAGEAVAPRRQGLVHFVEQQVGPQRAQRPALRPAQVALDLHPTIHDPDVQVRPHQPDHASVIDALTQPVHQDVVADPVEGLRQVHVHPHALARLHASPRGLDRAGRTNKKATRRRLFGRTENRLSPTCRSLLDSFLGSVDSSSGSAAGSIGHGSSGAGGGGGGGISHSSGCGCGRSGVSHGRGNFRSGSSHRSGHFFGLLAASGQGNSGNQGGQQESLVHYVFPKLKRSNNYR
jgi:hypothetical protein